MTTYNLYKYPEMLIADAAHGKKLDRGDRLEAVEYLLHTNQWSSNREMAKLFQCSERTICEDKKFLRL